MKKFVEKFKVLVPILCAIVFIGCIKLSHCEEYPQNNQQNDNGYSAPLTPSFSQNHQHHRNRHTGPTTGWGYPTESRTGIVVPLFLPMILFVGIVLLLFFAVVGSAAVAGGAIGRREPTRFPFARDFSSSAALARNVLSSEECVERISCEVFRAAKGYKAQNWILRGLSLLPAQSNLTKRVSRAVWKKTRRNHRSGKESNCLEFQCTTITSFVEAVKNLNAD